LTQLNINGKIFIYLGEIMLALYIIISILVGYLLCSINVSVIISKFAYKSDVRDHGSGNAGATNMARVYGLKGGLLVLLFDFAKAILACAVVLLICSDQYEETCLMTTGIACVVGHAYPIFFGFKGGKGVTVGAAIALMINWKALLFIVLVFIVVFMITHIVSISSISGALGLIFITLIFFVFNLCGVGNGYFEVFTLERLFLSMVAGLMVVWLHKENIVRLLKGEEKKFAFKKK
jgi:glycerol-3-phosphate acyltransferase PlsY